MKKILLFLLLLSATSAFAQDVIVKKDGSTILSKVLKITASEVEYKKYSNQNGPTYTIAKTEVMSINYSNGDKETFGATRQTEAQQPVQQQVQPQQLSVGVTEMTEHKVSDNDLLKMVTKESMPKSKKLRIAGWAVGGSFFVVGMIVTCLTPYGSYYNIGPYYEWDGYYIASKGIGYGFGIPFIAAGVATTTACLIRAHKLEHKSSLTVHSSPLYHHDLALRNGASLSTGIDLLNPTFTGMNDFCC